LLRETGRKAGSRNNDHGNQQPEPRAGVNVCERSEQPAQAGATLTPSTDQAEGATDGFAIAMQRRAFRACLVEFTIAGAGEAAW
jgi:hypothetical protein